MSNIIGHISSLPTRFDLDVARAMLRTAEKVAPVWPLADFVAVNPFVGLQDVSFEEAARTMREVAGARLTMPRAFYGEEVRQGRLTDRDWESARQRAPALFARLRHRDLQPTVDEMPPPDEVAVVPTVADVASELTSTDWSAFVLEQVAGWAESYFDRGEASWPSPLRELAPFRAWRQEAKVNRTPELWGLSGFRRRVETLHRDPDYAAKVVVARLGIPPELLERYLHRLVMTIRGWAGFARQLAWHEQGEARLQPVVELLAVRLCWDLLLLETLPVENIEQSWESARDAFVRPHREPQGDGLNVELALHLAYEASHQRRLVAQVVSGPGRTRMRPRVQVAFCIDVRSERMRRALETADADVETLGIAGFFGVPIEIVPFGASRGAAQCPALITPAHVVHETVTESSPEDMDAMRERRRNRGWLLQCFASFRHAAVTSFSFVETLGLAYGASLVSNALGWTRPTKPASERHLPRRALERLQPTIEPTHCVERDGPVGIGPQQRFELAKSLLTALSVHRTARLVVLCGHGSTTINNPHAAGLDCGACGGHSGAANARVAALLLNDPDVRRRLEADGHPLAPDTVFVPALHDTTTDEITILDRDRVPRTHASELRRLEVRLLEAGARVRTERAASLGLVGAGNQLHTAFIARTRDWSQVRPEWGLAGCSSFVIAPRHRTRGLDLRGRTFLHSYDWTLDRDFGVLEVLMTAPLVVASWISLQYYASTVDSESFGGGNKVLHNVVGRLGVVEGNGGDLKPGLPLQSVHDGQRWMHEPVRLCAVVEAPLSAIDGVIARHESVRNLVDNGWVQLFAMDDSGRISHRYGGGARWHAIDPSPSDGRESDLDPRLAS